jgi:hypothetical protein
MNSFLLQHSPGKSVRNPVLFKCIIFNGNLILPSGKDAATVDPSVAGSVESEEARAESVEFVPDFAYTTASDYLSHLGAFSCNAEGKIQDVSVRSHQDERHLNEHTDIQQTQGSNLQKDHPKLFRSRKVDVSRSHAPCVNGIFSPGRIVSVRLRSKAER